MTAVAVGGALLFIGFCNLTPSRADGAVLLVLTGFLVATFGVWRRPSRPVGRPRFESDRDHMEVR